MGGSATAWLKQRIGLVLESSVAGGGGSRPPLTTVREECPEQCGSVAFGLAQEPPFPLVARDSGHWDFGVTTDADGMTIFLMVMYRDGAWDWLDMSKGDSAPVQRYPSTATLEPD